MNNNNINLPSTINKYLLGGNLDLTGTIFGLTKNVRRIKKDVPAYSLLFYFNHHTARIERYIYNL